MGKKALLAAAFSAATVLALGTAYAGPGSTHTRDDPKKCRSLVTLKHLPNKADQQAEYKKCMSDPQNYQ
jgi:hypothetical protein